MADIPSGMFSSESERRRVMDSMEDQNDSERRQIRQDYRMLMDDLAEKKRDLTDPADENNLLQIKLLEADKLFCNVKQAREGALDSTCLVQVADLGSKKAQALQTDFVKFSPVDFCEKIKLLFLDDLDSTNEKSFSQENWLKLGTFVEPLFNKTPTLRFMCGSFERGEVSLKRRSKTKEEKVTELAGKATKPTQLSKFETVEGGGELTTVYVEHVLKTLWDMYESSKNEPVDYFEFVTHPTSFSQTVENIFYTSFLIRDGHARVSLDSEELPVIEPMEKVDGASTSRDESTETNQVVLSLTPAQWKRIVDKFEIQEPVIKPMKRVVDISRPGTSSQLS